jgi:D-alanyl-D-alanine carboxypeptidase
MSWGLTLPCRRLAVAGGLAILALITAGWDHADAARAGARAPAKASAHATATKGFKGRHSAHKRPIHGPNYHPPYAAIVIDDNSGQVLHEENADEPRHPASLTKIMTLYLLFEQIEAGKFKLDTPLPISAFAASQNPTKLNLKANQTILVEDAIKGLVTKSANDAAVVVAEAIGGTEADFGVLMTAKARTLGMAGTTYVNASGLPADEQITTARDQALLGRAVQDRFPVYYRYFSTPSFHYKGRDHHNHNALLGNVEGVDGIKTGYTEASGYNLVASVRRNGKHIVAVVLGGASNAKRDARMRDLITQTIPAAATQKTTPVVAEKPDRAAANVPAGARSLQNAHQ